MNFNEFILEVPVELQMRRRQRSQCTETNNRCYSSMKKEIME